MREKGEILADGLEAVRKETVLTQSDLKLTLLTLEVLVDIRDQFSSLTTILGSVEKIAYKTY